MKFFSRPSSRVTFAALLFTALAAGRTHAQSVSAASPSTGADVVGQSAADAIRAVAGSDGAFLAAGYLKSTGNRDDLATYLEFPTDEIVVLSLTGSQIKAALERSVSLFPQANSSFLQISGFEVTFSKAAAAGSRVISATADGSKLDDARSYTVAMPGNLGRGGLGFFKIWDRKAIQRTVENTSLEQALKNKRVTESAPRWSAQS